MAVLFALHTLFSLAPALRSLHNDFGNYYVPARLVREGVALDRKSTRLNSSH